MGRVCELIDEHCDVDFVDLNMGCPIELVCRKGGGAALQKRRKKVQEIVFHGLNPEDPERKIRAFQEIIETSSCSKRLVFSKGTGGQVPGSSSYFQWLTVAEG